MCNGCATDGGSLKTCAKKTGGAKTGIKKTGGARTRFKVIGATLAVIGRWKLDNFHLAVV